MLFLKVAWEILDVTINESTRRFSADRRAQQILCQAGTGCVCPSWPLSFQRAHKARSCERGSSDTGQFNTDASSIRQLKDGRKCIFEREPDFRLFPHTPGKVAEIKSRGRLTFHFPISHPHLTTFTIRPISLYHLIVSSLSLAMRFRNTADDQSMTHLLTGKLAHNDLSRQPPR